MSRSFWAALSAVLFLVVATPAWAVTYSVTGSQTLQTLHPGDPYAVCFNVTITSSHVLPVTLQSIRFKNQSAGPGTSAQLDAELGSPGLFRDTGSGVFEAGTDPLQKQSTASGGYRLFSGLNVSVPALGSVTLFVVTNIPTAVRDGDNLDLSIEAASDITLSTALTATNAFPVSPAGSSGKGKRQPCVVTSEVSLPKDRVHGGRCKRPTSRQLASSGRSKRAGWCRVRTSNSSRSVSQHARAPFTPSRQRHARPRCTWRSRHWA